MEVSQYLYTGNFCYDPLKKQENFDALTSLSEIVRTCMGPRGKLKLIRSSSGGHTIVSSSFSRIFHSLSLKNHFNRMIVSAAKSHVRSYGDGGLLCAYFPLSLIERSLSCDYSSNLKSEWYEHFLQTYIACLKSEENICVWSMNPSNLRHLRSVARTVLCSKLEYLLSPSQRNHVCALLLEMFLNIASSGDRSNFRFVSAEGRDTSESRLVNGLLLKVPASEWALFPPHQESAKVALFTSSLDSPEDDLKSFACRLISAGLNIVFCQKVVSPHLKKQINDAGVIVVDQLGTETTSFLRYILDECVSWPNELRLAEVECSKEEVGRSKHYIVLQRKTFCSLFISHYNQEFLSELKVVCEQVIATLFRLLQTPKVCFGAGCTDIFTALLLVQKIESKGGGYFVALQHFLQSVADVAVSCHAHPSSSLNFLFDDHYGHLWKKNASGLPEETCCCGHCTLSDSIRWHPLSDLMQVPVPQGVPSFLEEPRILDEFSCKVNAVEVGGGAAISLLKTHLCIFTGSIG